MRWPFLHQPGVVEGFALAPPSESPSVVSSALLGVSSSVEDATRSGWSESVSASTSGAGAVAWLQPPPPAHTVQVT